MNASTTPKVMPHATQIPDSISASRVVGACASRCRARSMPSITTISTMQRDPRPDRHVEVDEVGRVGVGGGQLAHAASPPVGVPHDAMDRPPQRRVDPGGDLSGPQVASHHVRTVGAAVSASRRSSRAGRPTGPTTTPTRSTTTTPGSTRASGTTSSACTRTRRVRPTWVTCATTPSATSSPATARCRATPSCRPWASTASVSRRRTPPSRPACIRGPSPTSGSTS